MSEWVTTSTLLLGLRTFDNHDAWDRLADRFRTPLVSFAAKMGLRPNECDDCAQETLLELAESFRNDRYDARRGRLSTYLFGIAYRKALHIRRTRQNRGAKLVSHADTQFWSELPDETTASCIFDSEWRQSMLKRCLAQVQREVAPQTYDAFVLTVCRGQSPEEAATQLGISRASVYTSKHRVLRRMRELRADLELVV